jgi:sugar phosphate isomerase/epimerase
MSAVRLELSSPAFRDLEHRERILKKSRELCENCGVEFGVQLHNTCTYEEIKFFAANGVPLSAHAPVEQPCNWNFAAADMTPIWKAVEENVAYLRTLGVSKMVFHGFFMTDAAVPAFGHGKTFWECMKTVLRPELMRWEGIMLNGDFTALPEYRERQNRVKANLAVLREKYPDLTICLENDFPAVGEGDMIPRDMTGYGHPLCLDTGHLWIAARLFKLDFYAAANEMIDSGQVEMMHLHASKYDDSYPDERWSDGHLTLAHPNAENMRLREIVRNAVGAGLRHIVLEIPSGTEEDIRIALQYLGHAV